MSIWDGLSDVVDVSREMKDEPSSSEEERECIPQRKKVIRRVVQTKASSRDVERDESIVQPNHSKTRITFLRSAIDQMLSFFPVELLDLLHLLRGNEVLVREWGTFTDISPSPRGTFLAVVDNSCNLSFVRDHGGPILTKFKMDSCDQLCWLTDDQLLLVGNNDLTFLGLQREERTQSEWHFSDGIFMAEKKLPFAEIGIEQNAWRKKGLDLALRFKKEIYHLRPGPGEKLIFRTLALTAEQISWTPQGQLTIVCDEEISIENSSWKRSSWSPYPIGAMDWNLTGEYLYYGSKNYHVIQPFRGEPYRLTGRPKREHLEKIDWNPVIASYLALLMKNGTVIVWEVAKREIISIFSDRKYRAMAWSADGAHLILCRERVCEFHEIELSL